jgi:Uncharacterized low-complexity proteins
MGVNFNYDRRIQAFKKIIKDRPFSTKYYCKSRLFQVSYINCKFVDVSFRGAIITDCSFRNCLLRGVEFNGTNLKNTSFKNAVLDNVIFTSAKLNNTNFQGAKFINVRFICTDLSFAKHISAKQDGIILEKTILKPIMSESLSKCINTLYCNKYLSQTRLLHLKGGKINFKNISVLLNYFGEDELILKLNLLNKKITDYIPTISSLIKNLKKMKLQV